jgi:hypothetical protein
MPLIISGVCVEFRLELSASVTAAGGLLSVPILPRRSQVCGDIQPLPPFYGMHVAGRFLSCFLVVNCVDTGCYACGGQYLFNVCVQK